MWAASCWRDPDLDVRRAGSILALGCVCPCGCSKAEWEITTERKTPPALSWDTQYFQASGPPAIHVLDEESRRQGADR